MEQLYDSFGPQPLELALYLDGQWIGRETVMAPYGSATTVSFFTPWIASGDHALTVFWDNALYRPWLRLDEIRVQSLGGYDNNTNGLKDWQEAYLAGNYSLETTPNQPAVGALQMEVSPACLEGRARFPARVALSGGIPVLPAAGSRWYADVPLAVTPCEVAVSFEGGVREESHTLVWKPFDLLQSRNVTLRAGDAMRLGVEPAGTASGQVQIAVGSVTSYVTTIESPMPYVFSEPGCYTVIGSHQDTNGIVWAGTSTVSVVAGSFATNELVVWANKPRILSCPGIPAACTVESDERMALSVSNRATGGVDLTVASDGNDPRRAVLRLGANGTILESLTVHGLRFHSSASYRVMVLETYEDGSMLIEEVVTLSRPLPGTTVELRIFVGGVTFDDGTVTRVLVPGDFDEIHGFSNRYVLPAEARTSVCHTTKLYHEGVYLGLYSVADIGAF